LFPEREDSKKTRRREAAGVTDAVIVALGDALQINTIVSPIATSVYRPVTVMPRQTSAMTLSTGG
jgi:hypothetical protein